MEGLKANSTKSHTFIGVNLPLVPHVNIYYNFLFFSPIENTKEQKKKDEKKNVRETKRKLCKCILGKSGKTSHRKTDNYNMYVHTQWDENFFFFGNFNFPSANFIMVFGNEFTCSLIKDIFFILVYFFPPLLKAHQKIFFLCFFLSHQILFLGSLNLDLLTEYNKFSRLNLIINFLNCCFISWLKTVNDLLS